MSHSYRAILRGDRLEWLEAAPAADPPLPVDVIVQDSPALGAERSDGARMAQALEEVAAAPVYRRVDDPSRWQRMVREDRPLPGRD
ncbi:MAG TPA: hypothetical protein VF615_11205 [Longimicrobiaceae bacterium]|jgi:hypothetical protein